MKSPYSGKKVSEWKGISQRLIDKHPLKRREIISTVRDAWAGIFESRFGKEKYAIGVDIFPKPQIMGFLLHELIPLKFAKGRKRPQWRVGNKDNEKDLVCVRDDKYSIEIKTSSSKGKIFGNRSNSQKGNTEKKEKAGYYLAINFEKFSTKKRPEINLIRFGWLDHKDWVGQKAQTGQQAHLKSNSEKHKLVHIFPE